MNNRLLLLSLVAVLSGCASSGPQTQYYSFFASDKTTVISPSNSVSSSIGIGPVNIPEYMDNPAIVSLSASQKVRVSGYHAWAGGLKESIVRTMSAEFQQLLPSAVISPFPWDARIRPKYQVQIQLTDFSGQRGGQVELSGRWVVIDQQYNIGLIAIMQH